MSAGHAAAVRVSALLALAGAVALSGCAARTAYTGPPVVEAPPAFLESGTWKPAQPQDGSGRGTWWAAFGSPELNALEERIDVSSDSLKIAAARYAQARAAVRGTRSALYPQVTAAPTIARIDPSGNRATAVSSSAYGDFILPVDVSYEADVWGRVRSAVNASRAGAQASAADLESVRLSLHAELALAWFALRGLDREHRLLEQAVEAYQRAFDLTQDRFRGGIVSRADVDLAETQLESTRAQLVDVQIDRAAFQHAIAVLVGESPSAFTVPLAPLDGGPPEIPIDVPSTLLERRPDIAAAERRMAQAGAEVGVAQAAFYPILMLSGSVGFQADSFGQWLSAASNFWSVAPSMLVTIFDGGRRRAVSDQARAAFTGTQAAYRLTVLDAFREVEDQLSTLRLLGQEADVQARATAAARRALTQATNRYQGGVVTYLEVIAAQTATLNNERAEVSLLTRRMTASVRLLEALGGGWTVASLPTDVTTRQP